MERQRLQLPPPPQRTTQAYRPPRVVSYNEAEEGEERWSDTPSEREEGQNEGPPRHKAPIAGDLNTVPSRHRRRATHHHRDRPLDPSNNNGEYTKDPLRAKISHNNRPVRQAIGYGRDPPPRPGGDLYHASPPGRYGYSVPPPGTEHLNPFAPAHQYPQPTHTQYGTNQGQHHTNHQHVPPRYPTNPPFKAPPLYHTPPDPLHPAAYPTDHNGAGYFPPHSPPTNIYPIDHGLNSQNPYTVTQHPIVPLYDEMPSRKPHIVDPEVEKLKKQIKKLKIRDKKREEKQREEEEEVMRRKQDEDEKAKRRKRKRKEQERLAREEESQWIREMEAKMRPKRLSVDEDFDDKIYEKKKQREIRAAMQYMAAGRSDQEILGRKERFQDNGTDDTGHILLAMKQFIEQRLQRQERLGLEERSVGTNFESRRGNRLEIVPFEPRVDIVTRTQIEDIVIDVLQRVGVRGQIQDTASAWDKSTVLSRRQGQETRSTRSLKSSNYESRHNGELEVRPGPGHHSSHESRQSDPRTPDSQGQFSDHTAVDNGHQYQPIQIVRDSIRLREYPGPRNGLERNYEKNAPSLRVKTSAPLNEYFSEMHDQSAEDEYPKKQGNGGHTTKNATLENEIIKRRSEQESRRRRRRAAASDTDESDDMFPRRSGQYLGKPPHGNRWHRVGAPPPTVPDAPQGESKAKLAGHKASVVTDGEEY